MDITKTIRGIIIQDLEGLRVFSTIYDVTMDRKQFEKNLLLKTRAHKTKDEILVVDESLVVHKFVNEFHFYVIGGQNENPLILDKVLECLVEVVSTILNKSLDKATLQKKQSQIVLAFEEICDGGVVLETDSSAVIQRIGFKDELGEQTIAQKLQSATEQFKFPWLRSYT